MLPIVLMTVWVLVIVVFIFRAIRGWRFFFQIRKEKWLKNLPPISRFEAKGMNTPSWWQGPEKTQLLWFRGQLLGLTLAAIPFNILTLGAYAGAHFGLYAPVWKPEFATMWLIMTLVAGWISGGSIHGQCLFSERMLRSMRPDQN